LITGLPIPPTLQDMIKTILVVCGLVFFTLSVVHGPVVTVAVQLAKKKDAFLKIFNNNLIKRNKLKRMQAVFLIQVTGITKKCIKKTEAL
jgi:SNF family Na+-dependent transporter